MPRRFKSSLSFLSTTFCARMSPKAFSSAALQAFVNTCRVSRDLQESSEPPTRDMFKRKQHAAGDWYPNALSGDQ